MKISELEREKYKHFFDYLDDFKNFNINIDYYKDEKSGEIVVEILPRVSFDTRSIQFSIHDKDKEIYFGDMDVDTNKEDYIDFVFPNNVRFKNNVELGTGYNYIFGKKTVIEGKFRTAHPFSPYILGINDDKWYYRIKTLGDEFIVKGNLDVAFAVVEKFPRKLSVDGACFFTKLKTKEKEIDSFIEIMGDYASFEFITNLERFKNPIFTDAKTIAFNNSSIKEIPKIKSNNALNKLKIELVTMSNSMKIPSNMVFNSINCTGTFIENIRKLKKLNTTDLFVKIFDDEKEEEKYYINSLNKKEQQNHKNKDIEYFEDKIDKVSFINILAANAPTGLHYKLLTGNIKKIKSKEFAYFQKNKENLEKYNDYDVKNIIYYCRNESAMKFLIENNYNFTNDEYMKITSSDMKNLYQNALMKKNIISHKNEEEINNKSTKLKI